MGLTSVHGTPIMLTSKGSGEGLTVSLSIVTPNLKRLCIPSSYNSMRTKKLCELVKTRTHSKHGRQDLWQ